MNEICKETRELCCCLDEKTLILMADGMRKEIRKITIGDYIFSADGKFCMVENIMQGRDENCLEISCENGFSVIATSEHRFLTTKGWITASAIDAETMLLDERNNPVRVAHIEKKGETHNVINLMFRSPTIFIANGLQSGDFAIQNGRMPE